MKSSTTNNRYSSPATINVIYLNATAIDRPGCSSLTTPQTRFVEITLPSPFPQSEPHGSILEEILISLPYRFFKMATADSA